MISLRNIIYIFSIASAASFLSAEELTEQKEQKPIEKEQKAIDPWKISEAFGHLIGKNIEGLGFNFDMEALVKGLHDHKEGKDSPLSENECLEALTAAQEVLFQKQAEENLEKSQKFLADNAKKKDIKVLEDGKVQYKVVQKGKGTEVTESFSPSIKYTGKFIDGTVFGASKEEEVVHLEETIPGFRKGIIGMKEGEKREIFIHPELAYGTFGNLPPNTLLMFEVEVVKANVVVEPPAQNATPATDTLR